MSNIKWRCPECGGPGTDRVLIDSEDRIYSKWKRCRACGYDERSVVDVMPPKE